MPKVSPIQSNFNGGEFSPLLYGRVDTDRYRTALKRCLNYVPTVQGSLIRRTGTRFVAEVKDSSKAVRLVPFEFSTTQAYILEFGDQYIRFYRDNGQILDGGSPYEIVSPYLEADLFELKFVQSADVLYITHRGYAPRKLSRTGHTSWTLTTIEFKDGPYLPKNETDTELSPSGRTGTITITASGTEGINDGVGFVATDVGRLVRLFDGYARITAVTSATEVTAEVIEELTPSYTTNTIRFSEIGSAPDLIIDANGRFQLEGFLPNRKVTTSGAATPQNNGTFFVVDVSPDTLTLQSWRDFLLDESPGATVTITGALTPTKDWRLGVWSDSRGWPACCVFHEDRLFFGGSTSNPQRIDGSVTGDYERFSPTDPDGTVAADNAVAVTLNANDVNEIRWMASAEKGLIVGTVGGEWIVRPSAQSEALSPTNVSAKQMTSHGSADIQAVQAGKAVLFVQARRRKLREISYFFDVDGFRANDMTVLAEHVTKSGIKAVAYQQEPQSIVWCVRNDGVLAAMTYERDFEVLRAGWSRHTLGGSGEVESVAVIPSPDGTRDEVWLLVKRTIGGQTKRYVEYITKFFEDEDDQEDAFFLDCGLSYDGSAATTISGLEHLEGETVQILADGAVHPDRVVSGGQITLDRSASKVHVGYAYNSDAQMLRIEAGAADGTALGKTRRVHRVGLLLHRTLGLKIGMSFDKLTELTFRRTTDAMGSPPSLFSGVLSETIEADYDFENEFCWRQDRPLPGTILAAMPQMVTQDRG